MSGGHEIRTRNPLRGTTFPVSPLAIRLPSEITAISRVRTLDYGDFTADVQPFSAIACRMISSNLTAASVLMLLSTWLVLSRRAPLAIFSLRIHFCRANLSLCDWVLESEVAEITAALRGILKDLRVCAIRG